MKKILMLCFAFFAMASVMAQSKVVTGRVTNQSGVGIPNVSVVVEGSTIGATTNAEGDFSLSVPAATKTLIVTSVGYARQEVPVTSGPINVTL
ncbi:MAG TPA: carboxypeptidase-like regulatory domain-containing protein, partial [Hanamia sp.]|nr:carboxypeptidase-like regulatory domain-containing protein [Hanamia sp.]